MLFPVLKVGYRAESCPTEPLGRFLVEMAMGKVEERGGLVEGRGVERIRGGSSSVVVSNAGFRRLVGLDG